jgi:branched-chain amino acid aminotransferase
MQPTKFIWQNGQMVFWQEAKIHVLSHGLHYGSAVFEGIRFYHTAKGPAIFKLIEHIKRFFYSAQQLAMELPYSEEALINATIDMVRMNGIEAGYIRPLAYYGYGPMQVTPNKNLPVDVIIACWPWGNYLATEMADVKVSSYMRIHPRSTVADAKISGHYVNSILAGLAIRNTHYHESLLLDSDGYVAESGSSNLFIVKENKLLTPATGAILEGITRNTVIELAQHYGVTVEQKSLMPEDIMQADEAFFTGTAVEITPIRSLNDHIIANGQVGPVTEKIRGLYKKLVYGELADFESALTFV